MQEPSKCKVVAIAEPRRLTQKIFAEAHSVDSTLVFDSLKDLLKASADTLQAIGTRLADAVVIAVQDQMHMEVTLAFAAQGYHILCEKPMATTLEDCLRMEAAVKKAGIIFGMGHGACVPNMPVAHLEARRSRSLCSPVLRYSPYSLAVTEVVRSGELGPLINAVHIEPIGYYHFAHSYVRGNWAREADSCFSLMTKSCQCV